MTRFEKTDLIASVIFRKLPSRDARQAQGSHRLAKEIAVGVMDELERISRMDSALPASPSVPICSPEFARLILPSVYTAADIIFSPKGGIAQERLEYVMAVLEQARDADKATTANSVGMSEANAPILSCKADVNQNTTEQT